MRRLITLLPVLISCCAPARAPDEHAPNAPSERRAAADEASQHVVPESEIRAFYALGWTPWQASRRDFYERPIDLLATHPPGDLRERVVAAVLVARMQESLSLDWRHVVADECKGDPTLCEGGQQLRDSAIRIWLDRARAGYRFCSYVGTRFPDLHEWRRYCDGRAAKKVDAL